MQLPIRPLACVVVALACGLPIVAEQPRPIAVARVVKPDDARRKLGLLPNYSLVPGIKNIKVAVLDSGFDGLDGKRPYLPANAVVVENYDPGFVRRFALGDPEFRKPLLPGNSHGRLMAQIVWATTGNAPEGPQFFLLNANGPTMFRRAVRYAIEQKVDVILFSGTFEGAGNYDGRGPINIAVDAALAAGIIWLNATGNCGGAVYNGRVDVGPNGFLRFGPQSTLRLRNRLDENALTLTLTWNDYQDVEDAGTEKDLDLIVEDSQGRVVSESKLTQVGAGRVAGDGESKNPRERLTLTDLPACEAGQEYRIQIRARAANFGPRDRIRLLLTPMRAATIRDPDTGKISPAIELLDATRGGEIYPPADHAGVLAVGDAQPESATGPTADGRVKPDVIVSDSVARFSNGEETVGASNAAAYFAGVVAVLRAVEPGITTGHIRQWVQSRDRETLNADFAPRPVVPIAVPEPPLVPRPTVPLSPNELRALRYSEYALEEKRVRGEATPQVILSTPSGTYVVRSGVRLPNDSPLASPPAGVARAQAPTGSGVNARPTLTHAPWQTPSPRQLNLLLAGKP